MTAPPPPLVGVDKVTAIDHITPKEYVGTVKAVEEVNLPSRIYGTITGIKFKEGSLVKKGELLFTIEDTSYRAKAMTAQANLDQQTAELKYAEKNYERQKRLQTSNAVSKSNLEEAERLLEATRAKYKACQAELLDARNDLSYTQIYAPISGRIGEVKHTLGNYVTPSSTYLAKIVSMDPIQVEFSISERDFLNLFKNLGDKGDNISLGIRLSNGKAYKEPGKIAFVDNVVDSETGTITIWTEFANPDMKLLPGGYVTVLLAEKLARPLPGILTSAVLSDVRGSYVYVLGADGRAVRRDVRLGEVVGKRILVLSGLQVGETVVADGTHKVIPGAPVTPVPMQDIKE
ncbi:MAG: efflux RND transporter periplasmic adaptor subunit [Victivallales bacterium]|nr:efflux RND transporter periplasmic adaptor subunit [Victivallales bacterium]